MIISKMRLLSVSLLLGCPVGAMAIQSDFNGDGRADVLLHSQEKGNDFSIILGGSAQNHALQHPAFSTLMELPNGNEWIAVAQADFNQDGKTDIWWHHPVTGENILYWMDGTTATGMQAVASSSAEWIAMLSGDFNHDGIADVIWRQQVSGALQLASYIDGEMQYQTFLQPVPWEWDMLDVGDVDQNGWGDVLLRHRYSGESEFLLLQADGTALHHPRDGLSLNWAFIGSGDVQGDGSRTLLWRDVKTGENLLETVADAQTVNTQILNSVVDDDWRVLSFADFDGDQRDEILWFEATFETEYKRLALYHIDENGVSNIDVSRSIALGALSNAHPETLDMASKFSKYRYYRTPWLWGALDGAERPGRAQYYLGECIEQAMQQQQSFADLVSLDCSGGMSLFSIENVAAVSRYIPNLETLSLSFFGHVLAQDTEILDLSNLLKLKALTLQGYDIKQVILPDSGALETLQANYVGLSTLDLTQQSGLLRLSLNTSEQLEQLQLPVPSQLEWLSLHNSNDSKLDTLDLTSQQALQGLIVSGLFTLETIELPQDSSALQTVWASGLPDVMMGTLQQQFPQGITSGFDDSSMEWCVREALSTTPGATLSTLTHLSCSYKFIENTTGLSQLSGLVELDLSDNLLTSIDLQANPNLVSVNLDDNQIASHLADGLNLKTDMALQHLSLNRNPLSLATQQWLADEFGQARVAFQHWFADPQIIACMNDNYNSHYYENGVSLRCTLDETLQGQSLGFEEYLPFWDMADAVTQYVHVTLSVKSIDMPVVSEAILPLWERVNDGVTTARSGSVLINFSSK